MVDERQRDVKVVDKRRFTEDGDLRTDEPREQTADPSSENESRDHAPAPKPEQAAREQPTEDVRSQRTEAAGDPRQMRVDFRHLVDFLGQQAAIVLGGAEGIPASPQQARLFIDLLDVLQEKTKNNLTPEEDKLLEEVLFQLRTAYMSHEG